MGVSLQTYRLRIGSFQQGFNRSCSRSINKRSCKRNLKALLTIIFLINSVLVLTVLLSQYWRPCLSVSNSRGSSCSEPLSPSGSVHLCLKATLLTYKPHISKRLRNFLARMLYGNRSQRGHGIKLLHWNKGPSFLHNKHQDVETVLASHRPHVLGLSEANLKVGHDLALVQHQDYEMHTCDTLTNPELGVSRIVAYSHKSLVVKRRRDLEDNTISAIWLEIGLPRQRKILHCQAYREWQYLGQSNGLSGSITAQLQRLELFLEKWELALMEGKEVVVMMDANIDFLKWTRDELPPTDSTYKLRPLIQKLFSQIIPHGVSQLVRTATRTWPGQNDSGLDHVYSNRPEKLSEVQSEYIGGSDHKLLRVVRFSKSLKRSGRYVKKRCFKNFKPEEFIQAVRNLSWYDLYSCEDVNLACQLLTNKLTKILDDMAPIRTIQIRAKYAPWLSDSTKKLLKERNDAQRTASASGDIDDWRYYKHLRNTATVRMRVEKKNWECEKLSHTDHDSGTLWKNVKGFLGWNNSGPPSQNSPAEISRSMNSFFISKVAQLREKIPQVDLDPHAKLREAFQNRGCEFKFKPAEPQEVLKIIKGLKNSKSSGIDFIDTAIVKLVANEILPALTHIINLSISNSIFPTMWKHSKVVPLLKKGDPLLAKNYRPVALLPILSKILEKVVFKQIVKYLDDNKLLSHNHHGSRSG